MRLGWLREEKPFYYLVTGAVEHKALQIPTVLLAGNARLDIHSRLDILGY